MTEPRPFWRPRGGLRRVVVVVSLVIGVLAPAVPAQAQSRSAPAAVPAPLQLVPDLLSTLLPGLFPSEGPSVLPPAVRARVAASTVRISGPACGAVQVGSGFAAGPDEVVTAAHVVAGVSRVDVLAPDGRRLRGSVVVFDPNRDLAVVRVDGLGEAPLSLGRPAVGVEGAVFGHPEGQVPVAVSPATVVALGRVRVENVYGTLMPRDVIRLASLLEPGDSGGPLVDAGGAVIGVAFAISTRRPDVAYAVNTTELEPLLAADARTPVSTGRCVA